MIFLRVKLEEIEEDWRNRFYEGIQFCSHNVDNFLSSAFIEDTNAVSDSFMQKCDL